MTHILTYVTVLEARRELAERLDVAEIASAALEADALLAALLGVNRAELILAAQTQLTAQQLRQLGDWQARRIAREPLQHILGHASFYGLELKVNQQVLIPRPETEVLVELVLQHIAPLTALQLLDVGTGSGAVAMALKHERPDAFVSASDISEAALRVARHNATALGLAVSFYRSDILTHPLIKTLAARLDVLVSNPPYLPLSDQGRVSPEVQRDPPTALYAGEDGLEVFRRLEQEAYLLLTEGAHCFIELDPRNVATAYRLAERWRSRAIHKDLVGRERFLQLER